MANATAGDTVYFTAGTYTLTNSGRYYIPDLQPANSGTADDDAHRIIFAANPGDVVILIPSGSAAIGGYMRNYVTWDGFKIIITTPRSGVLVHSCQYVTIQNCEIAGCTGTLSGNQWAGIYLEGADQPSQYNKVTNCYIHDFMDTQYGGSDGCNIKLFEQNYLTIEKCTVTGPGFGLHDKEGSQNATYRYNIFNNAICDIWFMTQGGYQVNNINIYQNIFLGGPFNLSADTGMYLANMQWWNNVINNKSHIIFHNNQSTGAAWNNIIYQSDSVMTSADGGNLVYSDYNCGYNPELNRVKTAPSISGNDAHSIATNPLFMNTSSAPSGYKLQAGSPCLNAGINRQGHKSGLGTPEQINMGVYITGTEQIGYVSTGGHVSSPPSGLRVLSQN